MLSVRCFFCFMVILSVSLLLLFYLQWIYDFSGRQFLNILGLPTGLDNTRIDWIWFQRYAWINKNALSSRLLDCFLWIPVTLATNHSRLWFIFAESSVLLLAICIHLSTLNTFVQPKVLNLHVTGEIRWTPTDEYHLIFTSFSISKIPFLYLASPSVFLYRIHPTLQTVST